MSELWRRLAIGLGFAVSVLAFGGVAVSLLVGGWEAAGEVSNVASAVVSAVALVVTLVLWIEKNPRPPVPWWARWRPGLWFTVLEVVLLPIIGIAVLRRPGTGIHDLFGVLAIVAPLVAFWPNAEMVWPRRGAEYLFRCIALPVLLIAATASAWNLLPLPSAAADTCGVARIEVDQALLPAVQMLFSANRSRLESGRSCVDAVEFAALGGDPHTALRTPQTPVAGVITADPAIARGLGGDWGDLAVQVAPPQKWRLLGQTPAVVFLDDQRYRTRMSVPLTDLGKIDLAIREVGPPDPVAISVQHTLPGVGLRARAVDLNNEISCLEVILPAGLDSACRSGGLPELRLEDAEGNTIGAEVLGIPLTAEGQRTSARAAQAFLNWLDRSEAREALELVASTANPAEVLERSVELAPVEPPLHLTVVLDASRSMSISERGATAPWTAAREAVLRWAAAKPLNQTDRLTVVLARTAAGPVVSRTVTVSGDAAPGLDLPGTRPGGETGLAEALQVVEPRLPGARTVVVLLTDGVNSLSEQPVPPDARAGLEVVVIGGACADQPGWARSHCRSTDANSEHIADQLTVLVEEP